MSTEDDLKRRDEPDTPSASPFSPTSTTRQPRKQRPARAPFEWTGSWVTGPSPFFDTGSTSFYPALPKSVPIDDNIDEREGYRSHQNLSSVLNDPSVTADQVEPPPFVLDDAAHLSDRDIGIDQILAHFKSMGQAGRIFEFNHSPEALQEAHMSHDKTEKERRAEQALVECLRVVPEKYFQPEYTPQEFFIESPEEQLLRERRQNSSEHAPTSKLPSTPGRRSSATNGVSHARSRSTHDDSKHPSGAAGTGSTPHATDAPSLDVVTQDEEDEVIQEREKARVAAIQSQLSEYLDLVEVNLLSQVSARSQTFFSALVNIQDLYHDVGASLQVIKLIRARMKQLHVRVIKQSFSILRQRRLHSNTRRLADTLELVNTVLKTQPTVKILLQSGDFTSALELLASTRQVLDKDLCGLACLKHVGAKLTEMEVLIEKFMSGDFLEIAVTGPKNAPEDLINIGRRKPLPVIERQITPDDKERLAQTIYNLHKLGKLKNMTTVYRESLIQQLRQRLSQFVNQLLDDLGAPSTLSLVVAASTSATTSAPNPATPSSSAPPMESMSLISPHPVSSTANSSVSFSASSILSVSSASSMTSSSTAMAAFGAVAHVVAMTTSATSVSISVSLPNSSPVGGSSNSSNGDGAKLATDGHRFSLLAHSQFMSLMVPLFRMLSDILHRTAAVSEVAEQTMTRIVAPLQRKQLEQQKQQSQKPPVASTSSSHGGGRGEESHRTVPSRPNTAAASASNIASSVAAAPTASTIPPDNVATEFHEVLGSVCEFCHSKCAKIVKARAQAHAQLELRELREFFDEALNFIRQTESLTNKTFYGFRGALLTQAKDFLVNFHSRNMSQLVAALESETWLRVEVPNEYQLLVDNAFQRKDAHSLPKAKEEEKKNGTDAVKKKARVIYVVTNPDESKSTEKPKPAVGTKLGVLRGVQSFPVVKAVLVFLDIIESYLECSTQMPAITPDITTRLAEILTLFNSRTCQLVLGAGALHFIKDLKSISASQLGLAATSVGLLATQIPVMRTTLKRGIQAPKQQVLLDSLNGVVRDFQDHQQEIFSKLINIVGDLVEGTCRRLSVSPWAKLNASLNDVQSAPEPDPEVDALMKQTAHLHRMLTELLTPEQRDRIFQEIGKNFSGTVCKYFSKIDASRPPVMRKVSKNVSFILMRLQGLPGCDQDRLTRELGMFITEDNSYTSVLTSHSSSSSVGHSRASSVAAPPAAASTETIHFNSDDLP